MAVHDHFQKQLSCDSSHVRSVLLVRTVSTLKPEIQSHRHDMRWSWYLIVGQDHTKTRGLPFDTNGCHDINTNDLTKSFFITANYYGRG